MRFLLSIIVVCLVANWTEFAVSQTIRAAIQKDDSAAIEAAVKKNPESLQKMASNRDTPLHFAIQQRKLASVKKLLDLGADVNAADRRKFTPLHLAIQYRNKNVLNAILAKNPNVNAKNNNGLTPLMMAISYSIEESTIKKMMDLKPDLQLTNRQKQTLLHIACQSRRVEIANLLIEQGAKIGVKDQQGGTAFSYALRYGMVETCKKLMEKGATLSDQPDKQGQTLLHQACQSGKIELVDMVIGQFQEVNIENNWGQTPLLAAIYSGHDKVVQRLIDKGANVNAQLKRSGGNTPLMAAINSGRLPAIKALLAADADPNIANDQKLTPLHSLMTAQGIVLSMQNAKPKDRKKQLKPYMDAIQLLLENKADANLKDRSNNTPLMLAANAGFYEAVELLCDSTTELNFSIGGQSMLHWLSLIHI